jgi:hypothetical protein
MPLDAFFLSKVDDIGSGVVFENLMKRLLETLSVERNPSTREIKKRCDNPSRNIVIQIVATSMTLKSIG